MKLVCLGDSLTYGYKLPRAATWPAFTGKVLGIEAANAGISGDTTAGMLSRFQNDVTAIKPSHVIITGGSNDFFWGLPAEAAMANLGAMVHQAAYHGIRPLLGVPIPADGFKAREKKWPDWIDYDKANQEIVRLRQLIYNFCAAFGTGVLDFYQLFTDNKGNPNSELLFDGLHPGEQGHKLMAELTVKILS